MNVQNTKLAQLQQVQTPQQSPRPQVQQSGPAFADILSDRLKVSSHAQTRLDSRNIEMDSAKWERVMQGVDRAAQKGAKESLVLCDEVALVVSVKNRTVITAVEQAQLKENVFTNIDSAVIV